jgi:hypothetical protein
MTIHIAETAADLDTIIHVFNRACDIRVIGKEIQNLSSFLYLESRSITGHTTRRAHYFCAKNARRGALLRHAD